MLKYTININIIYSWCLWIEIIVVFLCRCRHGVIKSFQIVKKFFFYYSIIYRVVKKKFMNRSRGKVFEKVFLSMFSHLLKFLSYKALKSLTMACFKITLSKKRHILLSLFYFCCKIIVIHQFSFKIAIEVIRLSIWPQKCLFLKRLELQNWLIFLDHPV